MIKERLVGLRRAKGWTQNELAEYSGYSRSSIINWETGKRAPRTVDIEKLASTLGVLPSYFLDDSAEQINLQATPDKDTENQDDKFAYWSGVLDETLRVADSGNMQKIALIIPLLKSALNILLATQARSLNQNQLHSGNSTYVNTLTSHGDNNQNIIENSVKE